MQGQNTSKLILVVEDNERNMKLAVDLLEFNGFKVLKASSGEMALEILNTQQPDLVLLDIRLSGISGVEVYKRVRQVPRLDPVRIVAFTASVMSQEKKEIIEMGFDGFITKPIDIANFIRDINMQLEGKPPGPHERSV